MKQNKYIELRDRYYQEAKRKSEFVKQLRRVLAEEMERSTKLKSELKAIGKSLSIMIHDISCKEQEVLSLRNECDNITEVNSKLYKARENLKQLETRGKGLAEMMKDKDVNIMTNMIDEWISYCHIVSKQIR